MIGSKFRLIYPVELTNTGIVLVRVILIFFFLLAVESCLKAQSRFQFASGLGNLEHYSVSAGIRFSQKAELSIIWGTDVFHEIKNFSTLLLNYEQPIFRKKTGIFIIQPGIKGGWCIYTNAYYRWKVVSAIPFLSFAYPFQPGFELRLQGGVALNHEISVERINWGEAGWYPRYLPELKVEFAYVFPHR